MHQDRGGSSTVTGHRSYCIPSSRCLGQWGWRTQGQWACWRRHHMRICLRLFRDNRGVGEEGATAQLAVCIQGEEGDRRALLLWSLMNDRAYLKKDDQTRGQGDLKHAYDGVQQWAVEVVLMRWGCLRSMCSTKQSWLCSRGRL